MQLNTENVSCGIYAGLYVMALPATIRVKANPFFTDFLCTWLGSVAKPTYSLSWSYSGQKVSGKITDYIWFVGVCLWLYLGRIVRVKSAPGSRGAERRLQGTHGAELAAAGYLYLWGRDTSARGACESGRSWGLRTGGVIGVSVHRGHLTSREGVSGSGGRVSHGVGQFSILTVFYG